jgi:hypothetical protein
MAALRGALVPKEETIAVPDQPREPVDGMVQDGHIPGHGSHPLIEERCHDPADAIALHDGVGVHHHDEVGFALLPGHRSRAAVEVDPQQGPIVLGAVDGGLLRQALAPVVGVGPLEDAPVGLLGVLAVNGQERLEVRRSVVHD